MKTTLIAEIGENHYGNWDICRGMVREAAANGADFAKFQTYTAEQFGQDHPWYAEFKRVEMPVEVHFEMQGHCQELGIGFLCSTFSRKSTAFLVEEMGCTVLKLASSRVTDLDLLDDVNERAEQVKTVYLSTGMSTLDEVRTAVSRLNRIETLCVLQCTSQYPTEDENVNLRAMLTLKETFPDRGIGFSDHSRGLEASVAAVALGAQVIEKHFTYSTRLPGDDHEGALTPGSLAELVRRIERVETMLGQAEKIPLPAEALAREALRVTMREVGFG
ncbi:MAG: N-acetylneuraminate synthase family protein [Candidatus Latescibacteria bacterium]|jgi:sialic acid synthase SpsE|nr:N-acetylneuraminate synthase family protein [Candidatus Latescibacterota bacterium]